MSRRDANEVITVDRRRVVPPELIGMVLDAWMARGMSPRGHEEELTD